MISQRRSHRLRDDLSVLGRVLREVAGDLPTAQSGRLVRVGGAELVFDRDQMRGLDRAYVDLVAPPGDCRVRARVDVGQREVTEQPLGVGRAAGSEPLPRFPV